MASQPGPWEDFQQPAAPVAPGPTVRPGRPRLAPPQTPTNAARDEVQLRLDQERLRREQAERELAEARRPGAIRAAEDPAGDAPATQRKDAGFFLRAGRANGLYEQHQVAPRGVIGQALADTFPNVANSMSDADRQRAEAAQRDFIGATLRYESGAAIPPAEFETQRRIYFPSPGDGPEVIAQKAEQRRNAIEALQRSAGQAANGIVIDPHQGEPADRGVVPGMLSNVVARTSRDVAPPPVAPGLTVTDPNEGPRSQTLLGDNRGELSSGTTIGETYVTPADSQYQQLFAGGLNQGLNREQMQQLINERFPQIYPGRQPPQIPDELWNRIERDRANHRDFRVDPEPTGVRTPEEAAIAEMNGHGGATEAAVINAVDSVGRGLPSLFSDEYSRRLADVRARHPVASIAGALTGSALAPGPRSTTLPGQIGVGVGEGAVYGFNSSGGDVESALAGGGIGAVAPVALRGVGVAGRRTVNALTGGRAVTPEAAALARAAADEDVPISRPIVEPGARDRMAYLEASVGTGNTVREGLEQTRSGIERRAGELGRGGTAEPLGVMGQRVQEAGERYIKTSGSQRDRLYTRAEELAGDAPIQPREAVRVLDEEIEGLRANSPATDGEINFLQQIRATLVEDGGDVAMTGLQRAEPGSILAGEAVPRLVQLRPRTVQNLRDLRTGLRGQVNAAGLTHTQAEARVLRAMDAAKRDIERDLGAANPEAVRAYQHADRFNAERAAEIRQVVQRVIGRRDDTLSGEQVMARLRTMAANTGDAQRLGRMWSKLAPDEALDAAATIAETAGRRSAEEGFTPGAFIAWARTLSPAARRTIFGADGAQSISNLRQLSRALMDTTSRLNNSGSGKVANWRSFFRDAFGGGPIGAGLGLISGGSALASGGAGLALGATTAAAGAGLRKLSARALMSPDMSRWLAAAPKLSTPSAIRTHIDRLQILARARRNQSIAQEMLGLRQTLLDASGADDPSNGQ